jgi:large repetitive protein
MHINRQCTEGTNFTMRRIYLILLLAIANFACQAQQNCYDAIPICTNTYSQASANSGIGTVSDLNITNQGCLTNGEVNSSWYILNATTAGNIIFTITPNNTADDYDFAVWDITDTSCAALVGGAPPIRCNFASLSNSTAGGLTGLNTTATLPSYGAAGPSFSSALTTTAGQTFIILINNNSNSTNGYTLSFTGSTSTISDITPPTFKNIIVPPSCNGPTSVRLLLKENVKCNSIASNGSDFTVSGGASISSATSSNCTSGALFTSSINLTFSSALAPGTYTINLATGSDGNTLEDNCGNFGTVGSNFIFTVLPPVKINATTQFGCSGGSSGSITASGTGGYLPYKYKLNNGTFNVGYTFNGLSAGSYTVSIKDSFGCIKDTVITLAPAASIIVSGLSSTNLTCFNANNGSITVTASGGNPPLSYAVNSFAYSASNIISGLAPGSYVVHTKDANGCIKDTVVLLTSPGPITYSGFSILNVNCAGGNNGSITFSANGGTSPLQYALNTGAYSSFGTYTGLSAGNYTLHVMDANNCIKDTAITLTQPSVVLNTLISNIINPTCSGGSGSITAGGSGGTSPFTYSINGVSFTSTSIFSGLSSGTYTVYVKDAGGCVATITAVLTTPGNIAFNSNSVVQPTCAALGSITVGAVGGTAPLTYAINTGTYSTTNTFGALAAGSYTLHAKDNNGCIHDTIINLISPSVPSIAISGQVNVTCSSPNTGSITVAASAGSAPYNFSFNGGAYGTGNTFATLGAGTYTITVQGSNACTASVAATIISSNTVTFATFSKTNIACSGTPLGTIAVSGSGGLSPYTYNINGGVFQSSGSFTNIAAGTYTIIIKDASGCTNSSITTILSSVNLTLSATSVNATCSNPGNGSITMTGAGGLPTLLYSINGSGSASSVNFVGPGTYTLQVTDALGCTKSTTVTITGPPLLFFNNMVIVIPPCNGGIGSITTSAIGGAPPYQFANGNGAFSSSGSFPNLPAGTYTIRVKDNNGCIRDTVINLIQPPPVASTTPTISNAACNGNATGSITIGGSGGTAPFQYNINGGAFTTSGLFTGLAAGTYTIQIKDANNCTGQTTVSINSNGNFYFGSASTVTPSCFNGTNGSVSFTGSGGTAPYNYSLNGGAYQSGNNFTSLNAGTYTLNVKDAGNCIATSTVTIANALPINITSILPTSPTCSNGTNGSVSFAANGGAGAYTFSLDGGAFIATTSFTSISSGSHTITVNDANGCTNSTVTNVPNPLPVSFASTSIVSPGCFGPGNGSITLAGAGGTAPYTYALNAGAFSSTALYSPLLAGTYTAAVKDANGCSTTTSITLNNVTGVSISQIVKINPACANSNNGSVNLTASSINTPLSFQINNGLSQSSAYFGGLAAGTFTFTAKDAAGCFKDTVVSLSAISNLAISSVAATNVLCFGDTTGSILINASGGSGALNYSINSTTFVSTNSFTGLQANIYTIQVQDNIGCTVSSISIVIAPPALIFNNANITAPYCNGSQDGTISVGGTGGTGTLVFSINNNPYSTTTTFTNLIQATYTFHIKDANGCTKDTSIFLQGPDVVFFSNFNSTSVSCFGASDGSVSSMATGGSSPYTFSLNSSAFTTTNYYGSLPAGTYTFEVKDNQGCKNDTVVNVLAPASSVSIGILSIVNNICRGDSNGSITVAGIGGTSPYTFSYGNNLNFISGTSAGSLPEGNLQIFVKDVNGCPGDTTIYIAEPDSSAQLFFESKTKNSCIGVYDAQIVVSAKYGFSPYTYFIDGANNGADSVFNNLLPGDHIVEVTDAIGCKSTGKYTVDSTTRSPSLTITNVTDNVCYYDEKGIINWSYNDVYYPVTCVVNTDTTLDSFANNLASGNYLVYMVDARGCQYSTSTSITFSDSMQAEAIGTAAKCDGDGSDGKAQAITTNGIGPFTYQWSKIGTTAYDTISMVQYGDYNVIVTDGNGCKDTAEFTVKYEPCCSAFIPNAFTPNNDALNDNVITRPFGPIKFLSFEIYDRWGQQVHKATSWTDVWNGTYNNQQAEIGTYFYVLRYKCPLSEGVLVQKGDITLIR